MPNSSNDERRQGQRVIFQTDILLVVAGSEHRFEGDIRDLSVRGVYIHTDAVIPDDAECELTITLSGATEPIVLSMEGRVVRNDKEGVAVSFSSIDLDSYTHLKNIVRYNCDDPDGV